MPLGIITEDQLNKELGRLVPKVDVEIINKIDEAIKDSNFKRIEPAKVVDIKRGRGMVLEVPESLRALVAEEAIVYGHTQKIADQFGISKSSVDAYKNGATSTASYNQPDNSLGESNKTIREAISDQARSRLSSALEQITDDKLIGCKVKDVASIAKDMSVIVKNMEPQGPVNQQNTQVIIYKPRMRDEDEFDIITVNE